MSIKATATITNPDDLRSAAERRAKALYPWRDNRPVSQAAIWQEALHLARQAGPQVMGRLIEIALTDEDTRVASVCCVAVLDRAYGRPSVMASPEGLEARIAAMTPDERGGSSSALGVAGSQARQQPGFVEWTSSASPPATVAGLR